MHFKQILAVSAFQVNLIRLAIVWNFALLLKKSRKGWWEGYQTSVTCQCSRYALGYWVRAHLLFISIVTSGCRSCSLRCPIGSPVHINQMRMLSWSVWQETRTYIEAVELANECDQLVADRVGDFRASWLQIAIDSLRGCRWWGTLDHLVWFLSLKECTKDIILNFNENESIWPFICGQNQL